MAAQPSAPRVDAGSAVEGAAVAVTKAPTPDSEVVPKVLRRTFTAEFKRQVLAEVEACTESGEVGAILRRHGLYSSQLTDWRKLRDAGLAPKKRGRKVNAQRELEAKVARLEREKAQLEQRLGHAEIIIDVQKKLSLLLGIPLKMPRGNGSDE